MELRFDAHNYPGIVVVYCKGRMVYLHEASELSNRVSDWLQRTRQLVLELSGVESVAGAGLGQLAVIVMWAQACRCNIRIAAPRQNVRELLELTNLTSVLKIHSTLDEAVASCRARVA